MSSGPLGTVTGVQLLAVFQSVVCGLRLQVALPASASAAKTQVSVKRILDFIGQDSQSTPTEQPPAVKAKGPLGDRLTRKFPLPG